jgi:hypothetical protein
MVETPGSLDSTAPQGNLIPNFHLFYWMGLRVNSTWPNFDWIDPYIAGPMGYYTNWGITKPDQEPEPSRPDTGFAAGANYTEVQRSPPVWGWSDEDPGIKHIFICRTSGACYCWLASSGHSAADHSAQCITQLLVAGADWAPITFWLDHYKAEVALCSAHAHHAHHNYAHLMPITTISPALLTQPAGPRRPSSAH